MSTDESSRRPGDGQRPDGGRPLVLPAEQHGPQRALLLVAASVGEPHPGGPGDQQLQAAGIGHDGLAAVDRPDLGGHGAPAQGAELDRGLEDELRVARLGQRGGGTGEEGGQPGRRHLEVGVGCHPPMMPQGV